MSPLTRPTYRENVAYLHRDCEVYRAEGFRLNVVDDTAIVECDQLGLSEDAFAQLGVAPGHPIFISQAEPPTSIPAPNARSQARV